MHFAYVMHFYEVVFVCSETEMFKELFTSESTKLRLEFISTVLKNSNRKFFLRDNVSNLFKSGHQKCFVKGVFENFAKFTWKRLNKSLLIAGLAILLYII